MNRILPIKLTTLFNLSIRKSLFTGVCLFFACYVCAQHYAFKQLTSTEGLIGSSVYSSVEDTSGFMWFATNRAICRYDGKNFISFGKAEGYTEEGAYFIYKDKRQVIWAISFNFKLFYFNGTRFIEFTAIPNASWLCEDDSGLIHVATRSRKIETINNLKVIQRITPKSDKPLDLLAFNIVALSKSRWLCSGNNMIYLTSGLKAKLVLSESCNLYVSPSRLYQLANGNVLLSVCSNIYLFDAKKETFTLYYAGQNMTTVGFFEDRENGDLFIATGNGVLRFLQGKPSLNPIRFLNDLSIHAIGKSKEGFYWFCTRQKGIFYGHFLSRHLTKQDGLLSDVQYIRASKGNVFYSSIDGNIGVLKDNGLSVTLNKLVSSSYSYIDKAVKLLNGEVHFVNSGIGPIKYDYLSDTYAKENKIFFLFDNQDVLFYGRTDTGSFYFSTKTKALINNIVIDINNVVKAHSLRRPDAIIGDSIFVYIYAKGYVTATVKPDGFYYRKYSYPKTTLNKIVPTCLGNLVLSTKANGIVIKTPKGNQYLNTSNGLVSNYCNNIYYENNQLWVCTEQGLSRITLSSTDQVLSIKNYTSDDYLLSNNVIDIGIADSLVYVTTDEGISIFNPNKPIQQPHSPGVYMVSTSISGHQVNHQQAFVIPYDQNNLSIYYEAITMKKSSPVSYRYRLKGIDTGYTYTTESNVNYAKLPAGKYEFIVYATSGNDIWSQYPATIEFTVTEPFWQTTWFSLLLILLIALVVLLIIKRRDVLLRLKQENKKRLVESELKALRLQMNPHFIFNTLNSLQRFILQYKPIEANQYIAKFSKLMRWIMAYSDKQQISLQEELEFLNLYIELEQLRFVNTFITYIELAEGLEPRQIFIPSLVIQPFVENAIKYGLTEKLKTEKGVLELFIKTSNNQLYVAITDNGVGRDIVKQRQKTELNKPESTGIKSTTERLVMLHANKVANPVVITDLFDDKGQAAGTKVELIIPLKYA